VFSLHIPHNAVPLTVVFKTVSVRLRFKRAKSDFASIVQEAAPSVADLNSVDLHRSSSEVCRGSFRAQRTKVPFVDRSVTTTGEVGELPSHRMVQCLLPENATRPKCQNGGCQRSPTEKFEHTDSHSGQTNRIVLTAANRVGRLYPPEVELLESWTAWKQKAPQVGVGVSQVRLRLRVLLSGQLGLLSLFELFVL
jgi:hypothetical protein